MINQLYYPLFYCHLDVIQVLIIVYILTILLIGEVDYIQIQVTYLFPIPSLPLGEGGEGGVAPHCNSYLDLLHGLTFK